MTGKLRSYCARCSYGEGFKDFYFGTVSAVDEQEAAIKLRELRASISPHAVEFKEIIPGQIIFVRG